MEVEILRRRKDGRLSNGHHQNLVGVLTFGFKQVDGRSVRYISVRNAQAFAELYDARPTDGWESTIRLQGFEADSAHAWHLQEWDMTIRRLDPQEPRSR